MATHMAGLYAARFAAPLAAPKDVPVRTPKTPAEKMAVKDAPNETRAAARLAFGNAPASNDARHAKTPDEAKAPVDGKASASQAKPPVYPGAQPKRSSLNVGTEASKPAPKTAIEAKSPDAPEADKRPADSAPNANLPVAAAPSDPKSGTPEPKSVDPEVDKILNTPGANGKTISQEAAEKTMAALRKHAELLKLSAQPDDPVSKYYKLKKAEALIKQGIPTGPEPKDPTLPAKAGTDGESSTYDIFDLKKIEDGIRAAESDPEVQAWLSRQQVYSQEQLLEERIKSGELPDVPKDPQTGLRTDYLRNRQAKHLQDPDVVANIARMPADKQQEAIGKAIAPFVDFGATPTESKKRLFDLVTGVARTNGAPLPVVDANYDPVKTPHGDTVLQDLSSGRAFAIGRDCKAVTDPNNGLPTVYNLDGTQTVTVNYESVQLDPSGHPVVVKNGAKHVYDPATNDTLRNPDTGNSIVVDLDTNAVVEVDATTGEAIKDFATGMPRIIDVKTGKPLINPVSSNAIVLDTATGAAVEVEKVSGKIIADANGNPVVVDPTSGYQVWDRNGNKVVADPLTRMAFSTDPESGVKTIINPKTGAPLLAPKSGATALLDPQSKLPIVAVTDKETGALIKNPASGNIVEYDEATGLPVLVDHQTGDQRIADPGTGYAVQDASGNSLYVDKATGFAVARDHQGKDILEQRSGAKVIYDPKTGVPIGSDEAGTVLAIDPRSHLPVEIDTVTRGATTKDANGNTVVMDPKTGKQMLTTDGKGIVIDKMSNQPVANVDGRPIVVNPYTGEYVTDKDTGIKVMIDPVAGLPVYQDPSTGDAFKDPFTGGSQVVDPRTGAALTDVDGNAVQVDPKTGAASVWDPESKTFRENAPLPVPVKDADGNPVTTADGSTVARDGGTGNTILLDPVTKQPVDGPQAGMPQLVDEKGVPLKDDYGNFVVQDKETGKPVAVDAEGKAVTDPAGNAVLYDTQGKRVIEANGNPVVLDKHSGAPIMTDKVTGEPLVDAAGNVYVADSVVGDAVTEPVTGKTVVLDKESQAPVLADADGKIYTDAGGNAYLADLATGKTRLDANGNPIVVDRNVGMPVVVDPETGTRTMVDGHGNLMKDPKSGAAYEIGKNGLPQLVLDNGDGTRAVIDPQTSKQMEINGNKVFIDPKTGQTVVNDPLLGNIDILTGKAPVTPIDGVPGPEGEKADKIWKMVRSGVGGAYWTTFGIVGAEFSKYAKTGFFNNTRNFHESRMTASAQGLVTMVMAGLRWAPGSPMYEKMAQGDPKTVLAFAEDMAAVLKYFGFYPKTAAGIVKYLGGDAKAGWGGVQLAGDNQTLYRPHPNGGGGHQIFLAKGQVNPYTGTAVTVSSWLDVPEGSFDVKTGVKNPLTAPPDTQPGAVRQVPATPGDTVAPPQFERWNPNNHKWENVGADPNGLPPGKTDPNHFKPPEPKPTSYAKYAASKLVNTIGTLANIAMGVGNTVGGSLQLYRGADQIAEAIKGRNAIKGIAGAFNVIGGAAYIVTGVVGVGTAVGLIARSIAGKILGVGLAIGNIATLIAIIVDSYSDPMAKLPQSEQWSKKVMEEFTNVDVFQPDAKQKLEEWFNRFAVPYYHERDTSKIKEDFGDTSAMSKFPKKGG